MACREDKDKSPIKNSFRYAFKGIHTSIRERNIKIHYTISVLVIMAGFFFSVSRIEWLFILTCIGGMIALEMVNTAIENVVDLVTKDFHPLAKEAKDIAAGAVLMYSIYSVMVGMIIFFPKIWRMFI
ncbi:MAG: diacylglycerol kinase family protein [Bacillus sp. (in: firmicutes)]